MKKIIKLVLVLTFITSPIFSFAQNAEIEQIQTVENSAVCVSINKSLRYRASDRASNTRDVLLLQNFLKEKGYLKAEPNGYFGEQTLGAVRTFQRDNNLVSAGFVGPLTRETINKLTCTEEVQKEESTISETQANEVKDVEKTEIKEEDKKIENSESTTEAKKDETIEVVSEVKTEVKEETKTTDAKTEDKKSDDAIVEEKKGEDKPGRDDLLPRVMFWWGKVNQHINTTNGKWETDPDGISGANLDYLTYCKKWYPKTLGIKEYKLETISTWHERYNLNNHTSTKLSYLCIQPGSDEDENNSYFFKIISPNGGEVYNLDESVLVTWKNNKASADKKINISLLYKNNKKEEINTLVKNTPNDGEEKISLAVGGFQDIVFGKNFKIQLSAESPKKKYEDSSKDFFTINKKGEDPETPVVDPGTTPVTPVTPTTPVENPTTPTTPTEPTTPTTPDPVTPDPVTPDPVVPVEPTTPSVDTTPRVSFWSGKVNQHTDSSGTWQTDPDGRSGANIDPLTYCQKWYPSTTSTRDYKTETISSWKAAGNTGSYPRTSMSTECVGGQVLGATISKNSNICTISSTLLKGKNSNEVKCLQQKLNQKGYNVSGTEGGREVNQFGYNTLVALKKFQADNGLKADGILGPQSRIILNK